MGNLGLGFALLILPKSCMGSRFPWLSTTDLQVLKAG